MNRRARVLLNGTVAGTLEQTSSGYLFSYERDYLANPDAKPVSLTLPLRKEPFLSPRLFPFFVGLLAEGNLKDLQCRIYKIDPDDDFTRLIKTTRDDVIGAVTVEDIAQ